MINELARTRSVLLYYFTGTGNSKRLAREAAKRFEEAGFKAKVKNIEDNKLDEEHIDYSCHGFVFLVICWGITPNMTKFMTSLPHAAGKAAFIIVSLGAHDAALSNLWGVPPTEGKCLGQGKRILERRGYKVIGGDAMPMPLPRKKWH
jgi:flavodoxin